jgi:hypothetical protein
MRAERVPAGRPEPRAAGLSYLSIREALLNPGAA